MPETSVREVARSRHAVRTAPPSGHLVTHLVLVAGAVVMVGPFVWELLSALKTQSEVNRVPPTLLPGSPRWENFGAVFRELPFNDMFVNSVLLTAGRTIAQLLFCSAAAYAFARLEFPGRNVIFGVVLAVLMVPSQLFLIPQYQIMQQLGWLNTVQALFVPGMFSAFGTFLLRQFFLSLPREIEEAARLDGANPFQVYRWIALPLARPGLLALAVLTILWSWNDLLWPIVVNNSPNKLPLSAGLALLAGQESTGFPVLMAGALIASAPMIVLFMFLQRQFISGIAFGGSKS